MIANTTAHLGEGEKPGGGGRIQLNPAVLDSIGFSWSGKRNETIRRVSFLFTPPTDGSGPDRDIAASRTRRAALLAQGVGRLGGEVE